MPLPTPALPFHPTGRPVLSARAIEAITLGMLQQYFPQVLESPTPLPFSDLMELLKKEDGVQFHIQDLPADGHRKPIGRAILAKRTILLDPVLFTTHTVACPFVVAHEIGHWLLHRHKPIQFDDGEPEILPEGLEIEETCRSIRRLRTTRQWVEWQANHFASTLLLPRQPLISAVEEVHRTVYPVTRNFGVIYKNRSEVADQEVRQQLIPIAQQFNVSLTSTRIRLAGIGRYVEQSPNEAP